MPEAQRGIWTLSQRRALFVIVMAAICFLAVKLWMNPAAVPDPQPEQGPQADRLADRINPNTATAAELAAIPTLGEKRAQEIVDYRELFLKAHPHQPAFARPDDLEKIKGIGPATVEAMQPYLVFSKSDRY